MRVSLLLVGSVVCALGCGEGSLAPSDFGGSIPAKELMDRVESAGAEGETVIATVLSSGDLEARITAAQMIRCLRVPPSGMARLLTLATRDADVEVQVVALRSVGEAVHDEGVAMVLRTTAIDASRELSPRLAAAYALSMDPESHTHAMLGLLRSESASDKRVAARYFGALGSRGAVAVPLLREALRHREAAVREESARALGAISENASEAVSSLISLIEDDGQPDPVRRAAATAVVQIGLFHPDEMERLSVLSQSHEDPNVRGALSTLKLR